MYIDCNNTVEIHPANLVGKSIAVLGSTGTGKTNTVAVLIEQLIAYYPFTIVDPESEYWGLREQFEFLVVGSSPNVDIEVGVDQAEQIAQFAFEQQMNIILDMLDFTDTDRNEFVLRYFEELWHLNLNERRPQFIVLEEAQEFIPQGGKNSKLKDVMARIAKRGRKRGFGVILSSQRPQDVDKKILSQARMLMLHRVAYPNEIRVYQDLLPMENADVKTKTPMLATGQCFYLDIEDSYEVQTVSIRPRDTYHVGATPELFSTEQPEIKKIDATLIESLQAMLKEGQPELPSPPESDPLLKAKVTDLERQLKEQKEFYEAQLVALKESKQMRQLTFNDGWKADIQRKRLSEVKDRIRKMPRHHRDFLRLLIEQTSYMIVEEIAAHIGVSAETVSSRPPIDLVNMGLIERKGRPFQYKSNVHDYAEKLSPALDIGEVVKELSLVE